MIQSFRSRGHLLSDTNPIRPRINRDARISLEHYDLSDKDLDEKFLCGEFIGLGRPATLKEIIARMERTYCGYIGAEYMHSTNTDIRRWFRSKFEERANDIDFPLEQKKRILKKLNEASVFENFLQTKYIGQKDSHSKEESQPFLHSMPLLKKALSLGQKSLSSEWPIRGRLNVLVNIIGKTYEYVFSEFEGGSAEELAGEGDGDVKYHMGFTSIRETSENHEVYLKILPNPSHLEAVAPVVNGYTRAQIDVEYQDQSKIIPIVIHGDAAVAGQGVVYETLQMSELPGYNSGGTIHFVINNQIGFTTDFSDGRSSSYCTSLAKMLDCPALHVNGDKPEAVVFACELAAEFRQRDFTKIFSSIWFAIESMVIMKGMSLNTLSLIFMDSWLKHKNPRELYIEHLEKDHGGALKDLAKQMQQEFKNDLSDRFNNVKEKELPKRRKGPHKEWLNLRWSKPEDFEKSPDTRVKKKDLETILEAITNVPEGFQTLKKAQKLLDERKKVLTQTY